MFYLLGFYFATVNFMATLNFEARTNTTNKSEFYHQLEIRTQNSEVINNLSLLLMAGLRAGLAGLNLGYPENPTFKPKNPS